MRPAAGLELANYQCYCCCATWCYCSVDELFVPLLVGCCCLQMAALQSSSFRLNGAASRPTRSSRRVAFKAVASSAFEKVLTDWEQLQFSPQHCLPVLMSQHPDYQALCTAHKIASGQHQHYREAVQALPGCSRTEQDRAGVDRTATPQC